MKNTIPTPTIVMLKKLYSWICNNCPDKPSDLKGFLRIIHRLIECQDGYDSDLLKGVHFSEFNEGISDKKLSITTFTQRATPITKFLLQPACRKNNYHSRLVLSVRKTGQFANDPIIQFKIKNFEEDFINAENKTAKKAEDNIWLCEVIRKMRNGKPGDYKHNQQPHLPVEINTENILRTYKWTRPPHQDYVSLFITIQDRESTSEYKDIINNICLEMGAYDSPKPFCKEYIFNHLSPTESGLFQAFYAAQKIQNQIKELDRKHNTQHPHILLFISTSTQSILDKSSESQHEEIEQHKLSLINNNTIKHNTILTTSDLYLKFNKTFNIVDINNIENTLNTHIPQFEFNFPVSTDIKLLEPDNHFEMVDRLSKHSQPSSIISITGPSGIGKTRLLYSYASQIHLKQKNVSYLNILDIAKDKDFSFIEAFYIAITNPTPSMLIIDSSPLISSNSLTNDECSQIDSKMIKNKLASSCNNNTIIIDNAQFIDSKSLQILKEVCRSIKEKKFPIRLIFSSRYDILAQSTTSEKIEPKEKVEYTTTNIKLCPPNVEREENNNSKLFHFEYSKDDYKTIANTINHTYLNNIHSDDKINNIVDEKNITPFQIVESLYSEILPNSYRQSIINALNNESKYQNSEIPYYNIIVQAAEIGCYFKASHVASFMTYKIIPEHPSTKYSTRECVNKIRNSVEKCLNTLKRNNLIINAKNKGYRFFNNSFRISLLEQSDKNIHKEIAEHLYTQFKQDCYNDPLLLSNHLLELNQSEIINIKNIIKSLYRSAWSEVNKNNFNRAKTYFNYAIKCYKRYNDDTNGKKDEIDSRTLLSLKIEVIFLDIVSGTLNIPQDTITRAKNILKSCKHSFRIATFEFEIDWIECYILYLEGNLLQAKERCDTLKQHKAFLNIPECRKLLHSLLSKILFKMGNMNDSIIQSRLYFSNEDRKPYQSHYILKTSDNIPLAFWLNGYPDEALLTLKNHEKEYKDKKMIRSLIVTYWDRILIHAINYDPQNLSNYLHKAQKYENKYSLMKDRGFTIMANYLLKIIRLITGEDSDISELTIPENTRDNTSTLYMPFRLTLLAEAFLKTDRLDDCRKYIDKAIHISEEKGERFYSSETYRIEAELCLKKEKIQNATNAYKKAIDIARKNNAAMLELRVLNSQYYFPSISNTDKKEILTKISDLKDKISRYTDTFDTIKAKEILKNH